MEQYIVEVSRQDADIEWVMYVGEAYKLPFTGTGLFDWKSSNEAVASIDKKGIIGGKAAGDTLLTVSAPSGKQAVIKVHVQE
ncbi:MAG: Ig-like domain-containing protein [Butyrivibrio sp.]|nr:Ig-like domain-containing protein [Butyrivibrio sp.]